MENNIDLEIYYDGKWQAAGVVTISQTNKSTYSPSNFSYNLEYWSNYTEQDEMNGANALSLRLPLEVVNTTLSNWPSFLLDILPQGAARKITCLREQIIDNEENDFLILKAGAINPVGNIRVASKQKLFHKSTHGGFNFTDILEKNELFLEHAEQYGAIVVGTSGAQGVAPKFLLCVDQKQKWHCDGAIEDQDIVQSYLIKFPRGKSRIDKLILESEKIYMDIAIEIGLNGNHGLTYNQDSLLIPRFDRESTSNGINRYGLESISSAAGHYQFGVSEKNENYLELISRFSSAPKTDIFEFIARDFLNIVMGNTDNHGRNTAFIKKSATDIRLSPLYDFAPMVMDESMIARSSKWKNELSYIPDFESINNYVRELEISKTEFSNFLYSWFEKLNTLPELFAKHKLSEEVIEKATRKYLPFMGALKNYLEK